MAESLYRLGRKHHNFYLRGVAGPQVLAEMYHADLGQAVASLYNPAEAMAWSPATVGSGAVRS